MSRILLFSHHNPKAVPPQSILIQQMLVQEGYETVLIGKGKTGLGRLFDVVFRGFYWMFRANVALVDVFGHRCCFGRCVRSPCFSL